MYYPNLDELEPSCVWSVIYLEEALVPFGYCAIAAHNPPINRVPTWAVTALLHGKFL